MLTPLRVLIVDDSSADAERIVLALMRAGYPTTGQRVETPGTLTTALGGRIHWNVIICNGVLRQLTCGTACQIIAALAPAVPVVVVSDAVNDRRATEVQHAGVRGVVRKNRLDELGATIGALLRAR